MKILPPLFASAALACLTPATLGIEMVWELLPGRAKDIGVGGDGSVWIVGSGIGNGDVFRWSGSSWSRVEGSGVRIAVGPQGDPWLVNFSSDLFHRVNNQWVEITQSGSVTGIGVGSDGTVLMPGGKSCFCGPVTNERLYRYTAANGFVELPGDGSGAVIEPDPTGWWVLDYEGRIFRWLGGPDYVRLEGHARDISRGANGDIWIIGGAAFEAGNDRIYRWNGAQFEQATTGQGRQISVAPDGNPWIVNDDGKIYRGRRLLLNTANIAVPEGAELRFPISLSYPSDRLTSVGYQLFRPDNSVAATGTLSFPPGTTNQTVTLATVADTDVTGPRIFRLQLANAVGADVGQAAATGTVLDDDVDAPVLTVIPGSGGSFAVRCTSHAGFNYQLQRHEALGSGSNWTPVVALAGTGASIELADSVRPPSQAFYRVMMTRITP